MVSVVDTTIPVITLLGIDPEGAMPNPRGLDVKVLPTAADGAKSGGRLTEIT